MNKYIGNFLELQLIRAQKLIFKHDMEVLLSEINCAFIKYFRTSKEVKHFLISKIL